MMLFYRLQHRDINNFNENIDYFVLKQTDKHEYQKIYFDNITYQYFWFDIISTKY